MRGQELLERSIGTLVAELVGELNRARSDADQLRTALVEVLERLKRLDEQVARLGATQTALTARVAAVEGGGLRAPLLAPVSALPKVDARDWDTEGSITVLMDLPDGLGAAAAAVVVLEDEEE